MNESVRQRFQDKLRETATGCQEWTACRNYRGYGLFNLNGKTVIASRLAWKIHHGPIPDGLWVLHRCDNPPCCNPDHLFLGTPADNAQDASRKGRLDRTHCRQGHPYDEANTRYAGPAPGYKVCRICHRENNRKSWAKRRTSR